MSRIDRASLQLLAMGLVAFMGMDQARGQVRLDQPRAQSLRYGVWFINEPWKHQGAFYAVLEDALDGILPDIKLSLLPAERPLPTGTLPAGTLTRMVQQRIVLQVGVLDDGKEGILRHAITHFLRGTSDDVTQVETDYPKLAWPRPSYENDVLTYMLMARAFRDLEVLHNSSASGPNVTQEQAVERLQHFSAASNAVCQTLGTMSTPDDGQSGADAALHARFKTQSRKLFEERNTAVNTLLQNRSCEANPSPREDPFETWWRCMIEICREHDKGRRGGRS
jgi:hypothetical protein